MHKLYFLVLFSLFLSIPKIIFSQCTGSGSIVTSGPGALGNPAALDPDNDGDIVTGGSVFSGCTGELAEFEDLTNPSGCSTCQIPWTPINNGDKNSDLWSGGGCGSTDIINDESETNTFGYFSIVDPDGICDNADEMIVFRMRVGGDFSGAFSYSFLISNDNLLGLNDPDGIVCCSKLANAGFEYEIQLKTGGSGAGVNIIDVDGVAGTDNCGNVPSNCKSYTLGTNTQKARACGSSCSCRSSGGDPQFLTFFVLLDDLDVNCSNYTNLSFVPLTSTSPNPALSGCTSVSDVGGAAELDSMYIDCPECEGVSYSGCDIPTSEQGCVLACTAESNSFLSALPVTLKYINGLKEVGKNTILWETAAEINTDYFSIERSPNGLNDFLEIGRIIPKGNETQGAEYSFSDNNLAPVWYYRIKFVDLDGSYSYSNTIVIQRIQNKLELTSLYAIDNNHFIVNYSTYESSRSNKLFISDINGRLLWVSDYLTTGNRQSLIIPTHSFGKGIYLVSLTDGFEIITNRIVL